MRIDFDHICLAVKGTPLLRDVTLSVPDRAFVSILGESGAGKTTLLRVANGLAVHDEGRVLFDGTAVDDLPANKRGVSMVFQDARLFPNMSVLDNVAFPLKVRGVGKDERRAQAQRMLENVQLTGLGSRRTHEISGGQRQRVALARALVANPRAVLMDEPFSALDESLREDMRALVLSLHETLDLTVLMVTHDPVEAITMSDQVVCMTHGAIEQVGAGADILLRPAAESVRNIFKDTVAIEGRVEGGEFCARKLRVPATIADGPALLVRTRAGVTTVKPLDEALGAEDR